MLKVAFFSTEDPRREVVGGIPTYINHRARILSRLGTEVWCWSFRSILRWREPSHWTEEWRSVGRPGFARLEWALAPERSAAARVLAECMGRGIYEFDDGFGASINGFRKHGGTVVHCHMAPIVREFLNARPLRGRWRKPVRRVLRDAMVTRVIRRNWLSADLVLSQSYAVPYIEAGALGLPLAKLHVLEHAYDGGLIHHGAGNAEDPAVGILFVGNLEQLKGVTYLLSEYERYAAAGGRLPLTLVGRDGFVSDGRGDWVSGSEVVNRFVQRLGPDRVRYRGPMAPPALAGVRARAVVCVVPSYPVEAGPTVAAEAVVQGKALVASSCVGYATLLAQYGAARLVRVEAPGELAAALKEVEDREVRGRLACGAGALAKHFTGAALAQKTWQLYRSLA